MSAEFIETPSHKRPGTLRSFWVKAQGMGVALQIGGYMAENLASDSETLIGKAGTLVEQAGEAIYGVGLATFALEGIIFCCKKMYHHEESRGVAQTFEEQNVPLSVALANRWDDHLAYLVLPQNTSQE